MSSFKLLSSLNEKYLTIVTLAIVLWNRQWSLLGLSDLFPIPLASIRIILTTHDGQYSLWIFDLFLPTPFMASVIFGPSNKNPVFVSRTIRSLLRYCRIPIRRSTTTTTTDIIVKYHLDFPAKSDEAG